jgi:hypothetical protein
MAQPTWRRIVERQRIPEKQGIAWTRILDCVTPGKLMKIEVVTDEKADPPITGKWQPADFQSECTADGDYGGESAGKAGARTDLFLSSAPLGALIGRIGGSTADKSIDKTAAPGTPSPIAFSVGRHCVIQVPTNPNGALYLSVNDNAPSVVKLSGSLFVDVYEAI